MTALTLTLTHLGLISRDGETCEKGTVDYGRTASFKNHVDQEIRCTSGHLWVTLENDRNDFVLRAGETLHVTGSGRVVIGGKGAYRVDPAMPPAMAC